MTQITIYFHKPESLGQVHVNESMNVLHESFLQKEACLIRQDFTGIAKIHKLNFHTAHVELPPEILSSSSAALASRDKMDDMTRTVKYK